MSPQRILKTHRVTVGPIHNSSDTGLKFSYICRPRVVCEATGLGRGVWRVHKGSSTSWIIAGRQPKFSRILIEPRNPRLQRMYPKVAGVSTNSHGEKLIPCHAWLIFNDFANHLARILGIIVWRELCIVKWAGFLSTDQLLNQDPSRRSTSLTRYRQ